MSLTVMSVIFVGFPQLKTENTIAKHVMTSTFVNNVSKLGVVNTTINNSMKQMDC
jgi:hypothetical protein